MSLDKKILGLGPAPRCGVTGFNATIETGAMAKNTSGSTISGMAYGESSGTGYMAIANDTMYIYNADGSSLGSKSITTGYANVACIYHDNKFWANCNGWRSYTIASSPTETIVGTKAAMINWLCDDPNDSNRYFCGYRSDSNVYTISKSNFLDDTPTVLFTGKIDYSSYGWDGIGSVTSDGDYIWVMAYNPSGNTTTIFQYDPKTWDRYTDSDYTTTAIGGSNYIGNMVYNRSNNRMWHVRAYSNGANKYVPIVGPTCPTPSTYTVDFLVVAGGGSWGANSNSGGAGAGGLRTSYGSNSGGGGSAESSRTLTSGSVYAAIVGSGAAAQSFGNNGATGSKSVFNSISSNGGGGGARQGGTAKTGGSGGGGAYDTTGAAGTANQGYAGGAGTASGEYPGGGGGGASEAGNSDGAGQGGDGLAVSITGSSVTYAGGGSGGVSAGGSVRTAGAGGGGTGAEGNNTAPTAGTANTGGGGGGGAADTVGAAGGSGIVIIRVATSNYSGTTTGSPTVTTSGSDTILKYTGSGTYTA